MSVEDSESGLPADIGTIYTVMDQLQAEGKYSAVGLLSGAVCQDPTAGRIALDIFEEENIMHAPWKVGQKWIIKLVTLYYVGEITEVGFGWVRMSGASWIHWTGRLSTLMKEQTFYFESDQRKPRTEYVGDVVVFITAGAAAYPWTGTLPTASIE